MPTRFEIAESMGEWLTTLAPYDVYETLTFSNPVQVNGACYWARRHLEYLEKASGAKPWGFWGVEAGKQNGRWHVHTLVGNVALVKHFCGRKLPSGVIGQECCMVHAWPCGYSRIFEYDPKLGAGFYVSKYVTKRLAEWEIFGLPATGQRIWNKRDYKM